LDRGIALWKSGQLREALDQLLPLSAVHPTDAGCQAVIGFLYYDVNEFAEAIPYLEAATRLKPDYELAWRALFHSRWEIGEHVTALETARTLAGLTTDADDQRMVAYIDAKHGAA